MVFKIFNVIQLYKIGSSRWKLMSTEENSEILFLFAEFVDFK